MRLSTRKPIFGQKATNPNNNMYNTSPNFLKPSTSPQPCHSNHRSTIIYSPRKSHQQNMYNSHSMTKVNQPISIKVTSPIHLPLKTPTPAPRISINATGKPAYSVCKFPTQKVTYSQPQTYQRLVSQ